MQRVAAARRAGYAAKRADATAWNLLRKIEILAAVKVAMDRRAERCELAADSVLVGLAIDGDRARS